MSSTEEACGRGIIVYMNSFEMSNCDRPRQRLMQKIRVLHCRRAKGARGLGRQGRSYPDVSSADPTAFDNPSRASKTNSPSPPHPSSPLSPTTLSAARQPIISVASVRSAQCQNNKHHVFRTDHRAAQEPHPLAGEPSSPARGQVWQA
jgi:hypothetical protein